jgi:hypothetical protein
MPFDSKEEKIASILFSVEQLAKMIRYDQKRKKILFGNYASRIDTIREMIDKEFDDIETANFNKKGSK